MASVSEIQAGKAYVELGTKDSKYVAGLNSAAKKLQQWGGAVRGIGLQVAGAGSAIFAPLAGAGAAFAEHGEQLSKNSKKTGVSVEGLSTLGYAAGQTGTDSDALTKGLGKMSKTLVEAQEGSEQARGALLQLGLTVQELNGLSQEDRLKKIADGISKIKDPAVQAAAAMKIFGKGGAELLPLLLQGGVGISALQKRARDLGLQWSGADAAAAEKFSQTLKDLWAVAEHGVDVIGGAVAPVMERFSGILIRAVQIVGGWVSEHKRMIAIAAAIAAGVVAAGAAIVILGTAISAVGIILGTIAAGFGLLVSVVGALISPIGLVVLAIGAGAAALLHFSGVGAAVGNALVGVFKRVWDTISFIFSNTSSLSDAWGAASTEAGIQVMMAWANVKAYLLDLWAGLKGFASNIWNDLGSGIVSAAFAASDAFLAIWAKTMHAWNSIVNATADTIQDKFLATGKSELAAALTDIDQKQQSGQIDKHTADQARTAAHKTYETYEADQRSTRDDANDEQLDKKLADIKTEADARKKYLSDLTAQQRADINSQTAAEKAANDKQRDDAIKAAKNAQAAYEAELKKRHDASGEKSLADQFKSFLDPLTPAEDVKKPEANDLSEAVGGAQAKAFGTFNTAGLWGKFGGGTSPDRPIWQQIADNTKRLADSHQNAPPLVYQ